MNNLRTRRAGFTVVTMLLLSLLCAIPALAATVVKYGTRDLVLHAGLIFQGEVIHTEARMDEEGNIHTWVDFSVWETLKGKVDGQSITLRFDGGTVGDLTLDVGSRIPRVGEQGFYFVEDTQRYYINPLLGWSQGHLTITQGNAVETVDGKLVVDIQEIAVHGSLASGQSVAAGFKTLSKSSSAGNLSDRPLSAEEFRARLRFMVQQYGDLGVHPYIRAQ